MLHAFCAWTDWQIKNAAASQVIETCALACYKFVYWGAMHIFLTKILI